MANTNAFRAKERVKLAANMLFPPQYLPDSSGVRSNMDTEEKRKKRAQLRAKAGALHEKHERDRWSYETDLWIEDITQQLQQNPALHHTRSGGVNRADSGDNTAVTSEIELTPRAVSSEMLNPVAIWPVDLFKMLQRAPAVVRAEALQQSIHGQVAGTLLRSLYHFSALEQQGSFTKAVDLFQALFKSGFGPGAPFVGEARNFRSYKDIELKRIWKEFSGVAPYWAALLVLKNDVVAPTDQPLNDIDFAKFSMIAAEFANFGLRFKSLHTKEFWRLITCEELVSNVTRWKLETPLDRTIMVSHHIKQIEATIINLEQLRQEQTEKQKLAAKKKRASEKAALDPKSLE